MDSRVGDEVRGIADPVVAEEQLPTCLLDRCLNVRMWVLVLGKHACPERHVGEVPTGREGGGVPRVTPDVAHAVTGASFDRSTGVLRPCLLRATVGIERDRLALPLGR